MSNQLISIIIPIYNRENLIEETLDSIVLQTHTNWECIIVDDGSSDKTLSVLEAYQKKENRVKFFKRDANKPKGANACRNIGLDKALGQYIVFFDSDDLMTSNHLEVKINAIKKNNLDFVITRTKYFNYDNSGIDTYYNFKSEDINSSNYIQQKINWLTLDVCIDSKIAKQISFNETLQSGQEYNYYSKLVKITTNAMFVDEVVSLRRHHSGSVRQTLDSKSKFNRSRFFSFWQTYLDLKNKLNVSEKVFLLRKCIDIIYKEQQMITKSKFQFVYQVFSVFNIKGLYFVLMILSLKFFKKGFYFRQKLVFD